MNPEPIKILLVAKAGADAIWVQAMLLAVAKSRFELTSAVSLTALAHLAKEPSAVLLLELPLPNAQGLEAVNEICITYPQLPIVVLSDTKDEKLALLAIQMGAQDYLIKEQMDAQLLVRSVLYAIERQRRQTKLHKIQQNIQQPHVANSAAEVVVQNSTQHIPNEATPEEKLSIYREIIANSHNAIAILNPQGFYLEQNLAHRLLLGYSDPELCGKTPALHLGDEVYSHITQALLERGSYRGEELSRAKSGTLLNIELSAFAVQNALGKPVCYVSIKRDITQEKQAEAALKKRDQLLAAVATATNYLLTTNDFAAAISLALSTLGKACQVDRVYIYENHVHPHTGELITSQHFVWTNSHLAEPMDNLKLQHLSYKAFFPRWQETLAAGKPISGIVRNFPQIERERLEPQDILSLLVVPILIEGEFWGFLGFDDCHSERQWTETEQAIMTAAAGSIGGAIVRKQTEEALRESERRFRAIFEYSGIGIGLASLNGLLIDNNSALSKMLGYSREELQHMSFVDYTYQNDVALDLELFQELLAEKRDHYEIEKRYIHKDGRLLWGFLTVSLIRDSLGNPQFAIGMIEDITERKQTEMYLRDSKEAAEAGSRAKSEFLATMSHELRTPLNAILGLSQLLQQQFVGALNAKQHEYLSCIYSSGEHLLALINDILDLSKIEVGKEELMCTPLAVEELCDYCIAVVRDRAQDKGLELTSQIAPQVGICIADDRRAKQMLLNLLSNAIKFTPVGRVSLNVQKVPEGITFTVTDTGIGIAPEQLELIFQPFQQLDSQLNRQYEGTGLGLALTRKLARLHGGDVTVQSTLGVGSHFTLFLPDLPISQESEIIGAGLINEPFGHYIAW